MHYSTDSLSVYRAWNPFGHLAYNAGTLFCELQGKLLTQGFLARFCLLRECGGVEAFYLTVVCFYVRQRTVLLNREFDDNTSLDTISVR